MGRERRRFPWEEILGRQAWCAKELAPILGISVLNTRRYLRRSYEASRLERKKFGIVYFYAVKRFLSLSNGSYMCPTCKGRMEVYHCKCGCLFQICTMHFKHSKFKYCARHCELKPKGKTEGD